jgi:Tol biopolymer transport system component
MVPPYLIPKSRLIILILASTLLSSCTGYPRFLNFPFEASGRSLNSLNSELTPQVTDKYIVFASDRNGSQDIYLYDAKSRRLVDLPGLNSLNEIASDPSISEDGRYIVFAANVLGKSSIYLYDRQTQQKRNLSNNIQGEVRNHTISADASLIAFEVATNGQWDIYICDRFGKPRDFPKSYF